MSFLLLPCVLLFVCCQSTAHAEGTKHLQFGLLPKASMFFA